MKICLPLTARPHKARLKLLIKELKKHFEVIIFEPKKRKGMSEFAIQSAAEFHQFLKRNPCDTVIIRGDRYEMLGPAMVSAYNNLSIIHIEGGDLSGVIDNKVRHAITHLSDYHFCTNEEARVRLVRMGVPIDRIWNYGSLDVEYAAKVKSKKIKKSPYILVAYHPIENEDEKELDALEDFKKYDIIRIRSNTDYGRGYGEEEFSPEDYINIMRFAECCVGNSSSLLKEASIMGVGVVNVGSRQHKRLKPHNVIDVPCEAEKIQKAIEFQINNRYKKDLIYFRKNTSVKIVKELKKQIKQKPR